MVPWKKLLPPIGASVAAIALVLGMQGAYADDLAQTSASAPVAATSASYPTRAIYRLYNPKSGEHLYTPDAHERSVLASGGTWNDEGIGWYAPRDTGSPVYRIYDPSTGDHLYTTDLNERNVLSSRGWKVDNGGKALFLSDGSQPILRLYDDASGRHLITKDTNEYRVLERRGWLPEGIKLYGSDDGQDSASWPMGDRAIATEASDGAVEATVSLDGTGTGSTALLVAAAGDARVGFGLRASGDPATTPTEFVIENVLAGDAQTTKLVPCGYAELGCAYRLLLEVQPTGVVDVYVNGVRVKSVKNPALADSGAELRLEAAGASVGDEVQASFGDVKLKNRGRYDADEAYGWRARVADDGCGIEADVSAFPATVTLGGTVSALSDDGAGQTMRGVGSVSLTRR